MSITPLILEQPIAFVTDCRTRPIKLSYKTTGTAYRFFISARLKTGDSASAEKVSLLLRRGGQGERR